MVCPKLRLGVRPLWGRPMWEDLWERGQREGAVIYHVPRRRPLQTPGNDEADTLAKIWALVSPRGDQALWFHRKTAMLGPELWISWQRDGVFL